MRLKEHVLTEGKKTLMESSSPYGYSIKSSTVLTDKEGNVFSNFEVTLLVGANGTVTPWLNYVIRMAKKPGEAEHNRINEQNSVNDFLKNYFPR
jgi:hypothetical protein